MATLGWRQIGDPAAALCKQIDKCRDAWSEDPAFRDVLFHLRRAEAELDVICASPGRREALRLSTPDAGQIRHVAR
jgi:hypothetical protein